MEAAIPYSKIVAKCKHYFCWDERSLNGSRDGKSGPGIIKSNGKAQFEDQPLFNACGADSDVDA